MFEVELKYAVADELALRGRLERLGFASRGSETNLDVYFEHPCRDFRETGEALRLRFIDGRPHVTYKGGKQVLSEQAIPGIKSRREIEWSLAPGDPEGALMREMLNRLGFAEVAEVIKRRETFVREPGRLAVTIDHVEVIGVFAEVEVVVGSEAERGAAIEAVAVTAAELGLSDAEPRSYLRMVLEQAAAETSDKS